VNGMGADGTKRKNKPQNFFGAFIRAGGAGSSMRIRFFVFLFAAVILMIPFIAAILLSTGQFSQSRNEIEKYIEKEFSAIYQNFTGKYGNMSIQLVSLSRSVSAGMEQFLSQRNITAKNLQDYPEILEELIGNELNRLMLSLERTDCSGVFIILDATVNPALTDAENSRAGLYIRHSEPRVQGPTATIFDYYRGFPHIAYQNHLGLTKAWEMEFDIEGRGFFLLPMEAGRNTSLPLNRLNYWSMESIIPGLYETMIVSSIPLIDSSGAVFGVCGIEISAWNFGHKHAPDDSDYKGVVSIIGEMSGERIKLENALFAGKQTATRAFRSQNIITVSPRTSLSEYTLENGNIYLGLHEEIRLYAADSPFTGQRYAMMLLMPKELLSEAQNRERAQLILICAGILLIGAVISGIISIKYLTPIMSAFEAIRSGNLDGLRTNIAEIDDVIGEIRNIRTKGSPLPEDIFNEFIKRTGTLLPVEKKIFYYYIDGTADKEIMPALFITKEALRKHSERIYEKLNVSGKNALMLYIELIKMSGQINKIAER